MRVAQPLAKTGLFLVSSLIALGVAEVGFRAYDASAVDPSNQVSTRHDTRLGWSLDPGTTIERVTAEYEITETINRHGRRGPDREIPKPAGTRRVLLLGDSFLEGYTVEDDEVVSAQLEDLLNTEGGAAPVEVINGGVAGYSTDQQLLFFDHEGAAYQPDVTVLLFHVNDVWFNGQDHYWRGAKPFFRLEADGSLALENAPVPPPDPDRFAFEVKGGTGAAGFLRRLDAWLGSRLHAYLFVRSRILRAPVVNRLLIRKGIGAIPGEWTAWSVNPDKEIADAWRITDALLQRLRDHVEAAGSEFAVLYVPASAAVSSEKWEEVRFGYDMDDSDWSPVHDAIVLGEICERRGLRCRIDPEGFRAENELRSQSAATPLYFDEDAHWTAAGHRYAAQQIAGIVQGLLTPQAVARSD